MTYRVAVVGLGRIGWLADQDERRPWPRSHVSAWHTPGAELVAACEADPARAKEASAVLTVPVFDDVTAMLVTLRPDIVSVATPPATHLEVVEACAGVNTPLVLCEKPLATSSGDARAMVEACQLAGTILLVNHGRRFHHLLQAARADLLSGRIGKPLSAAGICSGGLWSGQSHMVDLLRFFLGEMGWVVGHKRGPCSEDGLEDGYDAVFWFRDGPRATLHAVNIARYIAFDLNILGETGALRIDAYGCRVLWATAEDSYPLASGYRWLVENGAAQEAPCTTFLAEMASHAVAVLDGVTAPASTGEDGLECVRVLEAITLSHATGRSVPL